MERNIDYTLLYRVAKAYYVDKKTQQEIADVENFSRSQISRLLKRAIEEELVTYTLNFPNTVDESVLAEQVRMRLGLEQVVLIPSFYHGARRTNSGEVYKNLSLGAAERLGGLLGDAKVIGVGWGRTLYNTSLYIRPQKPVKGRILIPLIGSLGDNSPMLQVNTIVDRFGESFHAGRKYINLQSLQDRDNFNEDERSSLQSLAEKWDELDAAIVGVGSAPSSGKNLISEFPQYYKKQVRASGTVGDILSQFFYEDGRIFDIDTKFRLLALSLEKLSKVKQVIALAAGADKCRPIRVAARLGYIKTLVTDYDTANRILRGEGETEL